MLQELPLTTNRNIQLDCGDESECYHFSKLTQRNDQEKIQSHVLSKTDRT